MADSEEVRNQQDPIFARMKYAAFDGEDDVRALLEEFPDCVEARSISGETALHWWAIEDHADAVKRLIKHGAQVNTKDNFGVTPLMSVSTLGNVAMAQLLIENRTDLCAVDINGDTALHHAALSNKVDVARLLVR